MPVAGPLDRLPLWLLLGITLVLLLFALEAGYRLGAYRLRRGEPEREAHVLAMVTATMGLLAFVMAFTFGLAANRFESMKQMVVEEANAVHTTYLRAGLLPADRGAKVRDILREYVELRLAAAASADNVERAIQRSEELHQELWREAEAAGRSEPESTTVGLFIDSVNRTIELHAMRVKVAIRARVPAVVWGALFLVAILGLTAVGYHAGLIKTSRSPVAALLVVNLSIILLLIADLNRPQQGTLRVSQQAMLDLRRTMGN